MHEWLAARASSYVVPCCHGIVKNACFIVTLRSSSAKRNVTVGLSVCLSVCLSDSRRHTHRDSPAGGSMRCGQRTFWPDSKETRHKLFTVHVGESEVSHEQLPTTRR